MKTRKKDRDTCQGVDMSVKDYREKIMEMVGSIENKAYLKRIYKLAEYLYIFKAP